MTYHLKIKKVESPYIIDIRKKYGSCKLENMASNRRKTLVLSENKPFFWPLFYSEIYFKEKKIEKRHLYPYPVRFSSSYTAIRRRLLGFVPNQSQ